MSSPSRKPRGLIQGCPEDCGRTNECSVLEHLHLVNVGPAPKMTMDLAPRLNLITGDNGLGKSFLLDVAWWTLAQTWPNIPARPIPDSDGATIRFRLNDRTRSREWTVDFDRASQAWQLTREDAFAELTGWPTPEPGLVLYAQVDGGFSISDPVRSSAGGPAPYLFRPAAVWNGLKSEGKVLCNGLIRDWVSWQRESAPPFRQLEAALAALSPSPQEELRAGEPTRISLDDVRDIPTLRMPYGQDVPVLYASAGMKRILQLAYLMVWAWHEQGKAGSEVLLQRREFIRQGDVSNWLTSEAFDLKSARSKEAEEAIAQAHALLRSRDQYAQADADDIDQKLRGVLGDVDPFWVRWSAFREEQRRGKE